MALLLTATALLALGTAGPAGAATARAYAVPSVASAPPLATAGAAFSLPVTFRNRAHATTAAATVALYLAPTRGTSHGTRVATGQLHAIRRGSHATLRLHVRIATSTRAGTYALLTCVLHGKVVPKRSSCVAARHAMRVTAAPAPVTPAAPAPAAPAPGAPAAPANTAPIAAGDTATTLAGRTLTVAAPGVLANDADADGDRLTAALATAPAHGTLTLDAAGGYTYTPDAGFAGTDSFIYTASDGTARSGPATVVIHVEGADLALTAAVDDAHPLTGDQVTFTLTIGNAGPDPATQVTVAAPLPAGLTLVSTDGDGAYDGPSGAWTLPPLTAGATATLHLVATVTGTAAATFTATIAHADLPDPDPSEDSAAVTVTPQQADLAIAASVDHAAPDVGDQVTFTIDATNHGPDTSGHADVSAPLPAGLTFVSATPSLGSYDGATGAWSVGPLISGGTAQLTIVAVASSGAPSTLSATVAETGVDDLDPTNDTGTATVTPLVADLNTDVSSDAPVLLGGQVHLTMTVTNAGPSTAIDTTASLPLSSAFASPSAVASQGTYDTTTGAWTIGALPSGTTVTLTVTATVMQLGNLTVSGTVTSSTFDPTTSDDQSSTVVESL